MCQQSLELDSRFSIDFALQEFRHVVARLCPTMSTRVYKLYPQDDDDEGSPSVGTLYIPNRSPFDRGRRRSETSLDTQRPVTVTPGQDRSFMCIARDLDLWYRLVHTTDEDEKWIESISNSLKSKENYKELFIFWNNYLIKITHYEN